MCILLSSRQESNLHHKLRKLTSYPLNDGRFFIHTSLRAAGNRTRSTSTPWMRTTGILQPVVRSDVRAWSDIVRTLGLKALLTARLGRTKFSVGVPGIEPGLHAPEACVLPVYYTPTQNSVGKNYRWSRIFSRRRSKIPRPRLAVARTRATSLRPAQRGLMCRRAHVPVAVHPSGFEPETFRM